MSESMDTPVGVTATQDEFVRIAPSSPGHVGPPRLNVAAQVRRHNLAVAWCLAAVSGALIIHAVTDLSLARLLAPVTAMFAYVAYALAQRQRNTAKLADSVYFMGFLWTLFALIDTLLRNEAIQLAAVFRVFGYALITTGCGMFIRLVLIQFTETVSDQLVDARLDVDLEVSAFLIQMRAGTAHMTDFAGACDTATTKFVQDLDAAVQNIGSVVTRVCSGAMAELVKDVKTGTTSLARELGALADATANLKQEVVATSKQIATSSRKAESTIATVAEQLELSGKRLEQTIEGLNTFLTDPRGAAVSVVQRTSDIVSQVSATADAIQRIAAESAQSVSASITELKTAIAAIPGDPELKRAAGELAGSLTGTAQELTRVTDQAKVLLEHVTRTTSQLEQTVLSMTSAVQQATGAVEHIRREASVAADAARITRDAASKVKKAVSEIVQFTRDRLAHP